MGRRGQRNAGIWALFAVASVLGPGAGEASAAVPASFRPGAAEACVLNVNRMVTTPVAGLDQFEGFTTGRWSVLNDGSANAGLPDATHVFLETSSTSSTVSAGDQFTLSFTMHLVDNGAGGVAYGLAPSGSLYMDDTRTNQYPLPFAYPSHVVLTVSLAGTFGAARGFSSIAPAHDLVLANPHFTSAELRMFFDPEGKGAVAGQPLIAKFTVPDPSSSFASTFAINQAVGSVIVNFASALPGVFVDGSGNEIVIATRDPVDAALHHVGSLTDPPGQAEFDFRFECATSGPCTEMNAGKLRLRLHMLAGDSSMRSLPPTTSPPGNPCGGSVGGKHFGNNVCFPFAFCPFPYFWFIVLPLGAIAVAATVVVVARRASGSRTTER